MQIILYLLVFAVGFALGVIAESSFSHGINIDEAARIVTDTGLPAVRKTSTAGEPYLGSNVSGHDFEIHFYSCGGDKKDEECGDMSLFAAYPVRNARLEPLNQWTGGSRVTKAYLNDAKNLAYLRIDIHTKEGVTKSQLQYYLKAWRELMPKYADYLRTGRL